MDAAVSFREAEGEDGVSDGGGKMKTVTQEGVDLTPSSNREEESDQ